MFSHLIVTLLASSFCYASPILHPVPGSPGSLESRSTTEPEHPTLKPGVRWDRRKDDWEDLIPKTAQQLYFGNGDPTIKHAFADVAAGFTGRAIILDHSDFIKNVDCSSNAIDITFSDEKAYTFAKKRWQAVKDFMLVTNSFTCGVRQDERSFWDVSDLKFGQSLTIRALVTEEKGIEDVLDSVDMSWGTYTPHKQHKASHRPHRRPRHRNSRTYAIDRRIDWNPLSWVPAIIDTVKELPGKAVDAVGQLIADPIGTVKQALSDVLKFTPDVTLEIPFDLRAPDSEMDPEAPWPKSYSLWNLTKEKETTGGIGLSAELKLYCVDCHFTGEFVMNGRAEWNVVDGLKVLYADTRGQLSAQLALGLVASVKASKEIEKDLIEYTPPYCGFVIPGVITVGAFIRVQAKAEVAIEIVGKILLGLKMTIAEFKSRLDFKNIQQSTKPVLEPKFEKILEAEVEIEAKAGISLPIAIGVGVRVPALKFDGTVSIVDQPGLNAEMKYSIDNKEDDKKDEDKKDEDKPATDGNTTPAEGSTDDNSTEPSEDTDTPADGTSDDTTNDESQEPTTENDNTAEERRKLRRDDEPKKEEEKSPCEEENKKGISWGIKFVNELYLDAFDHYKYTIHEFKTDLAKGCIPIGKQDEEKKEEKSTRSLRFDRRQDETTDATTTDTPTDTTTDDNTTGTLADSTTNGTPDGTTDDTTGGSTDDPSSDDGDFEWSEEDFDSVNDYEDDWTAEDYAEWDATQDAALDDIEEGENGGKYQGEYPDGTKWISIKDSSNTYSLVAGPQGKLRPGDADAAAGSLWAQDEGVVFSDYSGRFLRYNVGNMDKYGVAQITMTKPGVKPKDDHFIGLVPAETGKADFPFAYAAVNNRGEAFVLLTCNYQNSPSRVWLVKDDVAQGEKTLKELSKKTFKGMQIQSCANLVWEVKTEDVNGWDEDE